MIEAERTGRWWDSAERDPIHEAAAEWIARLQDPTLTHEEALAWQQWMSADPRHAEAFRRLEELREQFAAMRPPALSMFSRAAVREARLDSYDGSVPLGDWQAPERRRRTASWPTAVAASLAGVVVVAASLFAVGNPRAWYEQLTTPSVPFETAIGEHRTVRLDDGSQVTLGGGSELEVTMTHSARRLDISRGEAFFEVARDPLRPFSVRAGNATVTALGTQFNVRRADDRVVVAVVEGRVRVEPASTPLAPTTWLRELTGDDESVQLDAGHQTTVAGAGVGAAVTLPDPTTATAWRSGRLAFEREPLRYVLEDVNRYAAKPVVLADPTIGELLITGTVLDDSVEGWISSLESAFGLRAAEEPDRIVLRRE